MENFNVIKVSDVLAALNSGQSWTKKDDIGFGSIEKTYKLSDENIFELRNHPELLGKNLVYPTLVILDDVKSKEAVKEQSKIEEGVPQKASTPFELKPPVKVHETSEVTEPFM